MERLIQVVTPDFVSGKRVLLRYDIDVLIEGGRLEEFRLKAGLPTLRMCLEHGSSVTVMGHVGRPEGRVVAELRVAPIEKWFADQDNLRSHLTSGKLKLLENLRFDPREEACDLGYARGLVGMGDFYVNEAFSAYRPAVSTTLLPTLLPHAAGLRFAEEVRVLTNIRESPKRPFIAIVGGRKVEDKLPVINVLAKKADAVLVGGRLIQEIRDQNIELPSNVLVGGLSEDGFDITPETVSSWKGLIMKASMVVWNGPLGKFEDPKNDQTSKVAKIVVESGAETVVGGGDTIALLGELGLLGKFGFVSVGGGAMLKFLAEGTLPTIEVLS